jgi:hypothetical protein
MAVESNRRRRPTAASVLCVVVGLSGVGGGFNAIAWRFAPAEVVEKMHIPWVRSPLFVAVAIAYGVSAVTAALGLWRMRPWAYRAFCAFVVAALVLFGFLVAADPKSSLVGDLVVGGPALLFLGAGVLYVRKVIVE